MKRYIIFSFLLVVTFNIFAEPPNWEIIQGTQYSMVLISQVSVEGSYFDGNNGNIFAAFGNDENDCRGLGIWYEGNPGYWYMTIVGNQNNEDISFKIYDAENDAILTCNQIINFENNDTVGTPSNPFQFSTAQTGICGTISLFDTNETNGEVSQTEIHINGQLFYPAENGYFEIPLSADEYEINLNLNDYAEVNSQIFVEDGDLTEYNFTLIDWQPISGNQYNMNGSLSVNIQGQNIVSSGENQLAAFGPGGFSDCRGVAIWEEENQPYWDGYWFMTIVGNTQNELINFKYFDAENDEVIELIETIQFGDNTTVGSPENPFELSVSLQQDIDLIEGWNWISFNAIPEDNSISAVFSEIESNIFQIKNQNNSATFYDPPGSWVGDLNQIDVSSTYLIKMNNPVQLQLTGNPIDLSSPIDLASGWNWIGYYPQNTRQIDDVFAEILADTEQIKSQQQSAVYYNPPGTWVGDLTEMEPGKGYKLKVNSETELVYDDSRNIAENHNHNVVRDMPDWQVISGTQYSFVLMTDVIFEEDEFNYNGENALAAFGEDGTCRGVAVWADEIPGEWDGCWYITVVGNDEGEEISFKIYDNITDEVYDCSETIEFANNTTIGSPQNEYILTAITNSNQNDTSEINSFSAYPNPFNPQLNIAFNANNEQDISVKIINIKGQLVKTIYSGKPNIGKNVFHWMGKDNNNNKVGSGIYFAKILNGQQVLTKKVILLK